MKDATATDIDTSFHLCAAAQLLGRLGILTDGDGDISSNLGPAFVAKVHHTNQPLVMMAAVAQHGPLVAKGLYPRMMFADLIGIRPALDYTQATAWGLLGAIKIGAYTSEGEFLSALHMVVDQWDLWPAFLLDTPNGEWVHHSDLRPRGWSHNGIDHTGMADFEAATRSFDDAQRLLTATIIGLYRGGIDKTWLHGSRWRIHAADAMQIIGSDRNLSMAWHRLIALYTGW